MRDAVEVDADLTLGVDDHRYRVTGSGRRLVVAAPSLRAGLAFARGLDGLPFTGRQLARGVARTTLVVDVEVRGRRVARLAAGVRPGLPSRLLGAEPARLRLRGVLGALLGG